MASATVIVSLIAVFIAASTAASIEASIAAFTAEVSTVADFEVKAFTVEMDSVVAVDSMVAADRAEGSMAVVVSTAVDMEAADATKFSTTSLF